MEDHRLHLPLPSEHMASLVNLMSPLKEPVERGSKLMETHWVPRATPRPTPAVLEPMAPAQAVSKITGWHCYLPSQVVALDGDHFKEDPFKAGPPSSFLRALSWLMRSFRASSLSGFK